MEWKLIARNAWSEHLLQACCGINEQASAFLILTPKLSLPTNPMENSNKVRGWKTQEKKRNLGLITSACGLPLPWGKEMVGSILFLLVMPRALRLPRFKADPQVISNMPWHCAKRAGTAAMWNQKASSPTPTVTEMSSTWGND